MPIRTRPGQRGITLLELMMLIPVLIIVIGATTLFWLSGSRLAGREQVRAELEALAMRSLERLADDVRRAGSSQIAPADPVGTETELQVLAVVDISGDAATFAPAPVIWRLVYDPREVPGNGRDDDQNGLVDDGRLERTSAEGMVAIVATGVRGWDAEAGQPAPGFRFRRVDGTARLRLALTLERPHRGEIISGTCMTNVTVRNR